LGQGLKLRAVFSASADQIGRLVRASDISIREQLDAPRASARAVLRGAEVAVPLEGLIDFEQERNRLRKELENYRPKLQSCDAARQSSIR